MFDVLGENVQELRQECDAVEELCGPIQAPVQQFYQTSQPVRLQHVVPILPQLAEKVDEFDDEFEDFA